MFQVIINGVLKKEYPTMAQCDAWLVMNGYVVDASPDFIGDKGGKFYDGGVEIKEKDIE